MRKPSPAVLAVVSLVLCLVLPGCDRHRGDGFDGFDFEVFIAGSWSGTIEDSECGTGEIRFELIQTGDRVSGSWYVSFSSRTSERCWDPDARDGRLSGPLSGRVDGSGLTLTLQRLQGSAGCSFTQPISLIGAWTSRRLTGSYSGASCGATVTGTVTTGR